MERRLTAILAADIVGYSRLIGADEAGTLAALRALRKDLVERTLRRHRGRIVKLMGDGLLAEFASVVDAVTAAIEIQEAMPERSAHLAEDRRIALRIGVNTGDIVVEDGDIFGDGVNIAARLQEIADPNGVAISDGAHRELRGKLDLPFVDAGERALKNIAEPVRIWLWSSANAAGDAAVSDTPLALPDKPSIAVLPFDNMSGDPEQEYFADGIAEDLITALSRFRSIFVIARNSSFSYKDTSPDIRTVARELGVRFVVEGSVRKAGNRVRVTAQLIDATTGNHIWAERYDRELHDIFVLQDEITEIIVAAVEPEIGAVERELARRKAPENLDAWGLCQRGVWHHFKFTKKDNAEAQRLYRSAFALDPNFSTAYARLANAQVSGILYSYFDTPDETLDEAFRRAQRAADLDTKDPLSHYVLGRVQSLRKEHDLAIAALEIAIDLNPSFAQAHFGLAHVLYAAGELERVIPLIETAIRLSPRDPVLWSFFSVRARAHLSLRQYDDAVEWARKALQEVNLDFGRASFALISALAHLDRIDEAQAVFAQVRQRSPLFSISTLTQGTLSHFKIADQREHILDGLRKAGLPE